MEFTVKMILRMILSRQDFLVFEEMAVIIYYLALIYLKPFMDCLEDC